MEDNFLTSKDVEKILKISHNTAYKLIALPEFPKIRIGRTIRIPENDFWKYVETHKNCSINI